MNNRKLFTLLLTGGILVSANFIACSKGGDDNPQPVDPCAGKAIVITATPTSSNGCGAPSGSIAVSATGSTGFTYKLNAAGSYQAAGLFNGLAAGAYTVFVKDADGCEKSQAVTVGATGASFTINAATTPTNGCGTTTGGITITATGSTGFTYKLNAGGTYQASNSFTGLAEGSYTVFVKDGSGCENSQAVTVVAGAPGAKFSAVRTLLNARCISCHSGTAPAAGKDWSNNCVVVANKALINNRAVIIGDMPQGGPTLSAAEKAIITDWINAGGQLTN
ncbi:MAG: hypothetical protein EOO06_12150 [Chitinophagaceae bacterium]|nr:MAG: hypothetical protein EOO06_12150 [Chitinophagaceae bacterium]